MVFNKGVGGGGGGGRGGYIPKLTNEYINDLIVHLNSSSIGATYRTKYINHLC